MKIMSSFKLIVILVILGFLMTLDLTATEVSAVESKEPLAEDINQIASELDPAPLQQNYIMLTEQQKQQVKGQDVEYIESSVDYSQINSTMYGDWGVYKVDGHYVFCIQPGADTLSNAITDTQKNSLYSKFSQTTKNYLDQVTSSSIARYQKTDNTDYVFAGQLLIWEYLSSHERAVIGNPMESWNPLFLDSWTIRKSTKYQAEIATIESDVADYRVIPSFLSGSKSKPRKYTLKYNESKHNYGIVLTDTNHVWDKKYASYKDIGPIKVTNPSGPDNVRFETSIEHQGYFDAFKYQWDVPLNGTIELYDSGQDLIYIGADPVAGYLQLKTETSQLGGFKIKKVDSTSGEGLPEVKFNLIDSTGKIVDSFQTVNGGQYTSEKSWLPGEYTLVETKTLPGYIMDSTPHPITIEPSVITDYSSKPFENRQRAGGFKLVKVGERLDGQVVPLPSTSFEVTSKTDRDFSRIYTTDSTGEIETSNSELPYGEYTIRELSTIDNFIPEYKEDFGITADQQIVELNGGEPIVNYEYGRQVIIEKQGNNQITENKYPLANATFDIYREGDEVNQVVDSNDEFVESITTDADGFATSSYLPVGEYVIIEVESPVGYVLNNQPIAFSIINDETYSPLELGPVENELITGTVSLNKVGVGDCQIVQDECAVPLANVDFGIYQDSNGNQIIDKQEDKPQEIITTDEHGYAISTRLPFGNYVIQEIAVNHPNYKLDSNTYPFTIDQPNINIELNNQQPIVNYEKLGKISITKQGETLDNFSQNPIALSKAEYTIYDEQNKVVDVLTTDQNGQAESNLLSFGTYSLIETKAPSGYQLDSSLYQFTIDENSYQQPIELSLADDPITNQIEITKVDIDQAEELPGAKMTITDRQTDKVVEQWVSTSEAHKVQIKYGEYQICESVAPNGYRLNPECIDFDVTENGVIQEFTFENVRMKMAITGRYQIDNLLKLSIILVSIFIFKKAFIH